MTTGMIKKIPGFPVYHAGKKLQFATGQAVRNMGGLVFLSSTEGTDPDTNKTRPGIKAQTKLALERIRDRLEEFGTSLDNILDMWYFIVGPEFPKGVLGDQKWKDAAEVINEFWRENGVPKFCWENNPLGGTLLGISGLPKEGMLIEIRVVAALPPLGQQSIAKTMIKKIPGFRIYHAGQLMEWTTGHAVWNMGGLVFLSNIDGRDPDTDEPLPDIKSQTKLVMETMKARLEEFGTSLGNILDLYWFVVGKEFPGGVQYVQQYGQIFEVVHAFYKENGVPQFCFDQFPAPGTLLGVSSLAKKGCEIGVRVVAALPPLGS